ncbi:MAG: hypothetical protein ACREQP_07400 [Candidatus Binatia bacterium]
MKVPIEMSREHYDLFAAELDIKSPAYTVLKNNIVPKGQPTARDAQTIEILCEKEEAELLLDAATRHYPAAAPSIAKAIAGARRS